MALTKTILRNMRRHLLSAVLVVLLVLLGLVIHPAIRTRAYFLFVRAWATHCPLESARLAPLRIAPALLPLVPLWVQVEPEIRMQLDPNDLVARGILTHGAWEKESWEELARHLPRGGTFVDVGAHIGYYTLKAARAVGPTGRVIAVEPNPETVRKLRANIAASGASVVRVEPVACSNAETTLQLYAAARGNTGESSLSAANASQAGTGTKAYSVRARPLDALVREAAVARVDAVKIDVEGAELLVLQGSRETLTRYRPVLILELIEGQLAAMGTGSAEVRSFLKSLGYQARHSFEENIEFAPQAEPAKATGGQ
jgi:FkbM family methyltransferase